MSKLPLPDGVVREFANSYREWHYLAAGFSIGFASGVYLAGRWLLKEGDDDS